MKAIINGKIILKDRIVCGQNIVFNEKVADFCEKNKGGLSLWFTVDDLNHLKRGGRLSATAALVGGLLGIKPILHVDDQGKLTPVSKIRGRRQSLERLIETFQSDYTGSGGDTVFISHGDCLEDAEFVANGIRRNSTVKRVEISTIGPVVGSHSGPGTVALFFFGKQR